MEGVCLNQRKRQKKKEEKTKGQKKVSTPYVAMSKKLFV